MRARPPRATAALAGRATPEGTARQAARRCAARGAGGGVGGEARTLGTLAVAPVGAGTYLGAPTDAEDDAYAAALYRALALGVNVLDTAINYRCQRSERVVGRVLARAIADGLVARDEVVVCTKGGYVPLPDPPPTDRAAYQRWLRGEWIARGLLAPDELVGGGHAIAPAFLADQIARSRGNLGVETIDLYYLHNPEQQLEAVDARTFASRLRQAFEALEAAVDAGAIAAYGVSTWHGLRLPSRSPGHLSLALLVATAHEVAGDAHHLRAVQLPINLGMPEAVRLHTQQVEGHLLTPLEAAAALGLHVVASAPLQQGRLTSNLPPALAEAFPECTTDAQRALAFVRTLPGVSTVLVGARRVEHVEENLVR